MVGVPGKYKGCETCRRRRVKCSNERPFCHNCISSGRTCEGYERERVFITGTPENKGRVASHPKKTVPSKKPKAATTTTTTNTNTITTTSTTTTISSSSPATDEREQPKILPQLPLTSAWDDYTLLSGQGSEFAALVTAMQTNLQGIIRQDLNQDDGAAGLFNIYFPPSPSSTAELRPLVVGGDFGMNAQCFVHQKATSAERDSNESYCAFLFEHDWSAASGRLTAEQMARLGPRHFASFPNHHFFVRVYRPIATSLALLNRQGIFLSLPEWSTIPWEHHPKSLLDQLFDIILQLPSIFVETDRVISLQPTLTRRTQAQGLLHHCLVLEARFHQWLQEACRGTKEYPYPFWVAEPRTPGGAIPFDNVYTFKDGLTGLMFLCYWMSQILFHRCIESLHVTIFQPVVDSYPNMWPDLPPNLQIDPAQYQDGRELAANICRGLDSVLEATVQPDMLMAPITVASDCYQGINATSQDSLLEILWLEDFKRRLSVKSHAVSDVLQAQKWVEIARF